MSAKSEHTDTTRNDSASTGTEPAAPRHGRRRLIAVLGVTGALVAAAGFVSVSYLSPAGHAATTPNNCAANPSVCGFPDATNTGVPSGMALKTVPGQVTSGTGWHWDPRGWVQVDGNGAVLSGLSLTSNLNIAASNVTVNHVQLVESGAGSFGISLRHTANVTIENSTISGVNAGSGRLMVGIKDIYNDSSGLSILNNNISLISTGVQLESGLVQGNYIHDFGHIAGDHTNGITSDGGGTAGLLSIQRNTIFNNRNQTDAVSLFQDFGVQANSVINGNLLAGGSYTIYGSNGSKGASSNIVITNNRFGNLYYPRGGRYGPVTAFNSAGSGNVWSGNTWDSTGQPIRIR
jgi:hypothetical protein